MGKLRGPEGIKQMRGGEDFARTREAGEDDVEGHGRNLRGPEGISAKVRGPEGIKQMREAGGDDDVEGHGMARRSSGSRGE